MTQDQMKQTVASYFSEAFGRVRPIYAALCVASTTGHAPGDVLTWSTSKRETKNRVQAQWEPAAFTMVRIARVEG
jgi:hypothetical protein